MYHYGAAGTSNPYHMGANHMMPPAYPQSTAPARPQDPKDTIRNSAANGQQLHGQQFTQPGQGPFEEMHDVDKMLVEFVRVQEQYGNRPPAPYAPPPTHSNQSMAPQEGQQGYAPQNLAPTRVPTKSERRPSGDSSEEPKEVEGNKTRKKRSSEEQSRRNEAEKKRIRKASDTIDLLRSELVLHSGMIENPDCSPSDMSKQAVLELSLQQLVKLRCHRMACPKVQPH